MRVIHLSHGDGGGGAARAAHRIHRAVASAGVESAMWVDQKTTDDPEVSVLRSKRMRKTRISAMKWMIRLGRPFMESETVYNSLGVLPSRWSRELNEAEPDLVHLHWINNETMSIADIGRIRQPLVWTLHDMWPFSGTAHTSEGRRFETGYSGRRKGRIGLDLDRSIFLMKQQQWRQPIHIVATSRWMADCVRASALMKDWPLEVIPLPINTSFWRAEDRGASRSCLGLDLHRPVILFGGVMGDWDRNKGFAHLSDALLAMKVHEDAQLVLFGNSTHTAAKVGMRDVVAIGSVHDDALLRTLYSAADVVVMPSRVEAFGQVALEAMACGTPAVAFGNSGIADVVGDAGCGYLAEAFNSADLARGIALVLDHQREHRASGSTGLSPMARRARERVEANFSAERIGALYSDLYDTLLEGRT